jgi:hypothetical protein
LGNPIEARGNLPSRQGVTGKPLEVNAPRTLASRGTAWGGIAGMGARLKAGIDDVFSTWFGPGFPLPPMAPPGVSPRAFDYPFGGNIAIQPRAQELVSFAQLRALADNLDILRLCIETRKDQMVKLDGSFRLKADDPDEPVALRTRRSQEDDRVKHLIKVFEKPDGVNDWSTWLRILLEEMFVIDATAIYANPDTRSNGNGKRNGLKRKYDYELLAGDTIKRIVDKNGRMPRPPNPAFQQIIKGIPALDLSSNELVYFMRNPRANHIYGFSPCEQILLTVNVALRRETFRLNLYTEGTVPQALLKTPDTWTPQQIKEAQLYFDMLLAGNLVNRSKMIVIPGGLDPVFPKKEVLADLFDEWLARIVCFCFSLPPTPFIKQQNRATAESAMKQAKEEGLMPLMDWVATIITTLTELEIGNDDIEYYWLEEKEQDPQKQADIDVTYVKNGIKGIDEVRQRLGLEPTGAPVGIVTGSGLIPLGSLAAPGEAVVDPGRPAESLTPEQDKTSEAASGEIASQKQLKPGGKAPALNAKPNGKQPANGKTPTNGKAKVGKSWSDEVIDAQIVTDEALDEQKAKALIKTLVKKKIWAGYGQPLPLHSSNESHLRK